MSLLAFYRRRVRRIVPVAVVVLAVTCAVSWWALPAARARSISLDGLAALAFGANVRFAHVGTDYFASTAATSPLQHYWSLAVEEQFYLVWPVLLLAALTIGSRLRRLGPGSVAALTVYVVVVASFVWALHESSDEPVRAYFSSLSRAWELGVGALVALTAEAYARWWAWARTAAAWAGLGLIVYAAFVTSSDGFPAPGAVVPVAGTALVLAAGTGDLPRHLGVLVNPVARFVGDISYSVYLWHFPVIVLMGTLLRPSLFGDVAMLVLTFVLATITYALLEEPVLRTRRPARFRDRRRAVTVFAVLAALTVGVAATAAEPSAPVITLARTAGSDGSAPAAVEARSRQLVDALRAKRWPRLTPAVAGLGLDDVAPEWVDDDCLTYASGTTPTAADTLGRCVYGRGSATHDVVVVGDSEAMSWVPAIRRGFGPGWRVHVVTAAQCPFFGGETTRFDGAAYPGCARFVDDAFAAVKRLRPDLVVATSVEGQQPDGYDVTAQASAALARYQRLARAVVLVPAPPPGRRLSECRTPRSVPADCVSRPVPALQDRLVTAAQQSSTTVADPVPWFCVQDYCPAFVGGTTTYADGVHLTARASEAVAPVLVATVRQRLAADGHDDVARAIGR